MSTFGRYALQDSPTIVPPVSSEGTDGRHPSTVSEGQNAVHRLTALAEHPFELLFGLLFALNGLSLAAGGTPPASLNATLPSLVVTAWGVAQLVAGALIVVGIVLRYVRPATLLIGLRLERAGLWPLAAVAAVYSVVALGYAGTRALFPVCVLAAVAFACVARARAVASLEATIRKHTRGGGLGD